MKTLLTMLIMASVAFGQERTVPQQGPPPKNLTKRADGHFTANQDPANPEKFEVYTVKAGDTLSQIAGQELKNPRLWPQLWEQNEHIVNPHWIYPNDKILIKPITVITEAPPAPEPAPPVEEQAPTPAPTPPPVVTPISPVRVAEAPPPPRPAPVFDLHPPRPVPEIKPNDLYCSGFIRKTRVPTNMKVTAKFNSDGGALAVEGNYIYISQGAEDGVKSGDRFQVVRPTREIKNLSGEPIHDLGRHYLDVAQIQVVTVQPDFSMARVTSSCEAIEIGDLMIPYQKFDVPALPHPREFSPFMKVPVGLHGRIVIARSILENYGSTFKASGIIAGTRSKDFRDVEKGLASTGNIVYVDLGVGSGVKPGDIFIVYRPVQVDSQLYSVSKATRQVETDRAAIGEIVIVKVDELASSALVTYSSTALSAGDYVEHR